MLILLPYTLLGRCCKHRRNLGRRDRHFRMCGNVVNLRYNILRECSIIERHSPIRVDVRDRLVIAVLDFQAVPDGQAVSFIAEANIIFLFAGFSRYALIGNKFRCPLLFQRHRIPGLVEGKLHVFAVSLCDGTEADAALRYF